MSARTKPRAPSEPRFDATPERLARAKEAGQGVAREVDRRRRILDPFDVMRANRILAPHDPRLNDVRWLIGEALRRLHRRADMDMLRSLSLERISGSAPGPRSGLPATDLALHARDKMRLAEEKTGAAAWPILIRIVIEGATVADCRRMVPEVTTPWRADAIVVDRLRVALDALGNLLGVIARRP